MRTIALSYTERRALLRAVKPECRFAVMGSDPSEFYIGDLGIRFIVDPSLEENVRNSRGDGQSTPPGGG